MSRGFPELGRWDGHLALVICICILLVCSCTFHMCVSLGPKEEKDRNLHLKELIKVRDNLILLYFCCIF